MDTMYLIAAPSLVLGLLMIFFNRRGGIAFCKLGRFVFYIFKPIPLVWNIVAEVYNPIKAPKRFVILGSVFVVQAGLLVFIGSFLAS